MTKLSHLSICMLLPHIGSGGDWTAVSTMAKGLHSRGHQLFLAASSVDKVTSSIFEKTIEAPINRGPVALISSALQARKAFPANLDILHAHSPSALLFALLIRLLRCRRARIFMTFHWEIPESKIGLLVKRFIFRFADKLHVYSKETAKSFIRTYKISNDNVKLIYLGTETEIFPLVSDNEKNLFRRQFSLPEDSLVIGFAGRLNPEKNIPVVLKFMDKYATTYPHLHLLIMGDGPMRKEYEEFAQNCRAAGRIHFTGRLSPIRNGYGALDLLLLPSRSMETFGLVCVEAGLCGVPTLRSSIAGAIDQIEEGLNGWIYPKENDRAFEEKLCNLVENPVILPAAGREARKVFLNKFTMQKVAVRLEETYQELMQG